VRRPRSCLGAVAASLWHLGGGERRSRADEPPQVVLISRQQPAREEHLTGLRYLSAELETAVVQFVEAALDQDVLTVGASTIKTETAGLK
jgi:hypothetical protein